MTNEILIRVAKATDAAVIARFNSAMALETEGKALAPERINPGVKALFDHPEYGFYLVAEKDGQVAGCLMITFEWSDWRNGLVWWIQSVYIAPAFRRQGIYRRLYDYVRILASEKPNVCGFRLYVEKENHAAQKTYEALGMQETVYKMYEQMND